MKVSVMLTIITLAFTTVNAQAQAIQKAKNQHHRIHQGVRSGELTKAEAINLRNGQKEIRQDMRDAKADGVITPVERRDIKHNQRQESRKIFRKTHNARNRN